LDRIEAARAALRGFGLDYYGVDNVRLLDEKAPGKRFVFYGDSITEFWDLKKSLPGLPFYGINRGIRGQRTDQMLARFYFDVLQLKPRGVLLTAGTNDAIALERPEAIERNLDVMLYAFSRSGLETYAGTMPPVDLDFDPAKPSAHKREIEAAMAKVNDWLRRRCAPPACALVDFDKALRSAQKQGPILRDYGHPNEYGYQVMARTFRAALKGSGS
jgi:lysophospholipase L1-like esterase